MAGTHKVRAKRIVNFYLRHKSKGKKFPVNHFVLEGESFSSVYQIIQRYEDRGTVQRKSGNGRPPKIMTPKNVKRLVKMFDHKDDSSERKAAKKFKCSQPFIEEQNQHKSESKTKIAPIFRRTNKSCS